MTTEDRTRPPGNAARAPAAAGRHLNDRVRAVAARILGPYTRQHARNAQLAASVGRLEAEVKHLRQRHTEQIERLEDLVRELVVVAEALRRRGVSGEDG